RTISTWASPSPSFSANSSAVLANLSRSSSSLMFISMHLHQPFVAVFGDRHIPHAHMKILDGGEQLALLGINFEKLPEFRQVFAIDLRGTYKRKEFYVSLVSFFKNR